MRLIPNHEILQRSSKDIGTCPDVLQKRVQPPHEVIGSQNLVLVKQPPVRVEVVTVIPEAAPEILTRVIADV